MSTQDLPLNRRRFGETTRSDLWWVSPALVFLGFSAFIVYTTWAAFQGAYYHFGPYLSPLYSPEFFGDSPHALFGPRPPFWPGWLPFSPAFLILWAPAGFRFTCYYYRGAYYKAFWADPPACAVGEPRACYRGENSFPLILQNIHRYFFFIAALFIACLTWDAWKGLWFEDAATGGAHFGIGVGSLVLWANAILLGGYTFSCHSLRHLIGGRLDHLSSSPIRCRLYDGVSAINRRHMNWAWASLFWVGFTDVYVRLCSMGVLHDIRIL